MRQLLGYPEQMKSIASGCALPAALAVFGAVRGEHDEEDSQGAPEITTAKLSEIGCVGCLNELLHWAHEACHGSPPPCALITQLGTDAHVDVPKINSLGLWPRAWELPLTAAGVRAAYELKGKADLALPPVKPANRPVQGEQAQQKTKTKVKANKELAPSAAPTAADPGAAPAQRRAAKKRASSTTKTPPAAAAAAASASPSPTQRKSASARKRRADEQPAEEPAEGSRQPRRASAAQASLKVQTNLAADDDSDFDEEDEHLQEDEEPRGKRPRSSGASALRPTSSSRAVRRSSPAAGDAGASAAGRPCYWLDRTEVGKNVYPRGAHNWPRGIDIISCHDCQGPHQQLLCQRGSVDGVKKPCGKSYCYRCCRQYNYLFELDDDHPLRQLVDRYCAGDCPCCLQICARRDCLRAERPGAAKLPPPPPHPPAQRRMLALHLAWCLRETTAALLRPGIEAAAAQGKAPGDVPFINIAHGSRLLCNCCATCIEDVFLHCAVPNCEADICLACAKELSPPSGKPACPVCVSPAKLHQLQTVLPPAAAATLRDADAALQRARSAGGVVVDSYDFDNRLWRLLPPLLEDDDVDVGVPAPVPALAPGASVLPPPPAPQRQAPSLTSWHQGLPAEDYRLASDRPSGRQNYLWTPHVRDFARDSPRRAETVARFVERWGAGEPIVVRGFRGRMNWGPSIMMRAARDLKGSEDEKRISVLDCSNFGVVEAWNPQTFFNHYQHCSGDTRDGAGDDLRMLKCKDFPPENAFQERCRRHHADFTEMLNACMPEYMHPTDGALNLAGMLPAYTVPPDLGPKGYIAFGREEEHEGEGDSVTKLHEDLSDAINILCHVQHRPAPGAAPPARGPAPPPRCGAAPAAVPSYGGAGAVWDLFLRADLPALRRFLQGALDGAIPGLPPFVHSGVDLASGEVPILDVVHDQCFYLTAAHRAVLAERYGVHSWHVEQYEWEGVVIPAGSAHQVRNLRACIKVALDFVSPESVGECMKLREEFRRLAKGEAPTAEALAAEEDVGDRHFHDKLQAANMVLAGMAWALETLEQVAEEEAA